MATIVTRVGKGSPLSHAELDANFANLNADKAEKSAGLNKNTPLYVPTLATVDSCRILTGPYKDGYVIAPAGYLNVYFAALGLLGVLEQRPAEAKAFLNLVLNTLTRVSDGTRGQFVIYDVNQLDTTPAFKDPDSNDSYASVINTLAYQYAAISNDWSWYGANIVRLKDIAYFNVALPIKPPGAAGAGMARTFQTAAWGPYYDICLTQDNCEVYQGMDALAKGCTKLGLTADATFYGNVRDGIGLGMHNAVFGVWDQVNNRWYVGDHRPAWENTFYPDAVTQIFPEVYNVSSGAVATDRQRFDFGWNVLNATKPQWETTTYDDFPWFMVPLAAAMRGSFDQAELRMGFARRTLPRSAFTVNELGWQGRIERLLNARGEAVPMAAPLSLTTVLVPTLAAGAQVRVPLTSSPFTLQTMLLQLLAVKTTSANQYRLELLEVTAANVVTVIYQTALLTGDFKNLTPFALDRVLLANTLDLRITNNGGTAITGWTVRLVAAGV